MTGMYPAGLSKDKKGAVRRKAGTLITGKGEVFIQHQQRRVKVVTSKAEQARILRACHAEPTLGHFGVPTLRRNTC